MEKNNFKKEIKHVLCAHNLVKPLSKFVRILEQVKTLACILVFTQKATDLPSNSPKFSP